MTTEAKIREAFDKWLQSNGIEDNEAFRFSSELDPFTAGYMALLNELEPSGYIKHVYHLPEGVEK